MDNSAKSLYLSYVVSKDNELSVVPLDTLICCLEKLLKEKHDFMYVVTKATIYVAGSRKEISRALL